MRFLVGLAAPIVREVSWRDRLFELTGRDSTRCTRCDARIIRIPMSRARDPPPPLAS